MDKYIYVRGVKDVDNDDGQAGSANNLTSVCIPVRNITGILPCSNGVLAGDTHIEIKFLSIRNQGPHGGQAGTADAETVQDTIILKIASHKHKEVIDEIIRAINANAPLYNDGFIDVLDNVATNLANEAVSPIKISRHITDIGGYTSDTNITGLVLKPAHS
tara:strand:+ start:56 stop:538 length:483 start_codon:yes stop_codon:yes gene_type:complete